MKSTKGLLLFFAALLFVTGCQIMLGQKDVDNPTPVSTPNVFQAPVTMENSITPTASSYGNLVCPEINVPQNTADVTSGKLFYIDYDNYDLKLLDLQTMSSTSLIQDGEKMKSYALSPNGEWLVYQSVNTVTSKEQLIVTETKNDREGKTIDLPWEKGWDKVAYWLNNEQVIIKMYPDNDYRNLLLNPFSEEKQVLVGDFPNLYFMDRAIDWNRAGQFIYNSTLTRVVYAELNQNFVMWDLIGNKELARIQSISLNTVHTKSPQWTLSGDKVIIAAPNASLDYMNDELFSIDQGGVVQKMTDLTSIFSDVSINRYSWSPDNHYIAMLISTQSDNYLERLVVLDTNSHELDIYCINGDTSLVTTFDYRGTNNKGLDANIYKGVVWNPDSHQLIVENRTLKNSSRIILIDIDKKNAYEILNNVNYQPIGWIKN